MADGYGATKANGMANGGTADIVDLRSDTVTRPSTSMREAMLKAAVGDDVFGEDPTVNELQQAAAELMGKEAAIFVASGTMGNLAALLAHCGRGQEALVGSESHIYNYEAGGAAALGGVVLGVIPTADSGELRIEDLEKAIKPDDAHYPRTSLVCIEQTHNRCGGAVLSLEYMEALHTWASSKGLLIHLDGARIFNAATALGVPVKEIARHVTSVQFCLSKGLGAPVGSMVAGPRAFIAQVHRYRKMLGGGMRQVGVLAAPGLLALTDGAARLHEDHANAQLLAEALAAMPGIKLDTNSVHSNIVVFKLHPSSGLERGEFLSRLQQLGVLALAFKADSIRMVTHCDVSTNMCHRALEAVRNVLGQQ